MNNTHSSKNSLWFYVCFALLPILYIEKFGISYREPKFIALWVMAAGALLCSGSEKSTFRRSADVPRRPMIICCYAPILFLALQALSILSAQNFGLALERTLNVAAALALAYHVLRRKISVRSLSLALLFPLTVIFATVILRLYLGMSVSRLGAGLGGLVGERNPCAIFVAASMPLVAALLVDVFGISARRTLVYGALLQLAIVTVIAARCRNAWWMVFSYLCTLGAIIKNSRRKRDCAVMLTVIAAGVVAGAAIVTLVPNKLNWRSSNPYYDSLITIASPSHSNGRIDLWRVGLTMAQENFLWGVGAGNTVISLREAVPRSGADPWVFGFLRNDLPIFNDYLQAFVENGLFGGVLFLLIVSAAPLQIFLRVKEKNIFTIAGFLVLQGIALSCVFDYTLIRGEGIILFATIYAALLAESDILTRIAVECDGRYRRIAAACAALILCITAAYGSSFALRRSGWKNSNVAALSAAWILWPYDNMWSEEFAVLLHQHGEKEILEDFISRRLNYWPHEPRSFLAAALAAEYAGDIRGAVINYRRGLHEVHGGRCNWYVWREAERFSRRTEIGIWADAVRHDLFSCAPKTP